jgi:hypothetical protein
MATNTTLFWGIGNWEEDSDDGVNFVWAAIDKVFAHKHVRLSPRTVGQAAQIELASTSAQDTELSSLTLYYIPLRGAL